MIDYIAVTKHFQNKDKPFLNNCQIKVFYKDTGCTKYILHGCNDLKLYWYENSNTLKLQGSITYFIQGHNFTYSNSIFCEAIKTIENMLKCHLWDAYVDEFEFGKIIKVEYEPKEYITKHYSDDKKLTLQKMYVDSGVIGMLRLDSSKTFQTIAENNNEQIVANYFNSIVSDLNTAAKTSDSW